MQKKDSARRAQKVQVYLAFMPSRSLSYAKLLLFSYVLRKIKAFFCADKSDLCFFRKSGAVFFGNSQNALTGLRL